MKETKNKPEEKAQNTLQKGVPSFRKKHFNYWRI